MFILAFKYILYLYQWKGLDPQFFVGELKDNLIIGREHF